MQFKVSSFCNLGNCVEVMKLPCGDYVISNSKDSSGRCIVFTAEELDAFAKGWIAGEFG